MSESDPIENTEAVVKDRLEELADAVEAFESESRDADREIEAWTRRIREEKKASAVVGKEPSPEMTGVQDEAVEEKSETEVSGEERDGDRGDIEGVKTEKAPKEDGPEEEETRVRRQWFYALGGERKGPVSDRDLRRLLKTGRVPATTLVWTKGQGHWVSAEKADLVRVDEKESPPPVVPETRSEKDCPGCGVANREGAKYCRGCGHSLAEVELISRVRKEACPSCRAPVTPAARFCRSCGARLRSSILSGA